MGRALTGLLLSEPATELGSRNKFKFTRDVANDWVRGGFLEP